MKGAPPESARPITLRSKSRFDIHSVWYRLSGALTDHKDLVGENRARHDPHYGLTLGNVDSPIVRQAAGVRPRTDAETDRVIDAGIDRRRGHSELHERRNRLSRGWCTLF